jgi:hypothetical protein
MLFIQIPSPRLLADPDSHVENLHTFEIGGSQGAHQALTGKADPDPAAPSKLYSLWLLTDEN